MYSTGTQYNLPQRLHQLAQTTGDLNQFHVEYSGIGPNYKLEREFQHKYYELQGLTTVPILG